jgi:hypothetical protein
MNFWRLADFFLKALAYPESMRLFQERVVVASFERSSEQRWRVIRELKARVPTSDSSSPARPDRNIVVAAAATCSCGTVNPAARALRSAFVSCPSFSSASTSARVGLT